MIDDEDDDSSGESMISCNHGKCLYFVGDLKIKQVFSNNFQQVTFKFS